MEKLKLFEEFLNEDTIKSYPAWGKEIVIGIDNDDEGGFIEICVDGKSVGRVHVIDKDGLAKWKEDQDTKEDPNKQLPSAEDSTPPASPENTEE
jgi:hypothetical protein